MDKKTKTTRNSGAMTKGTYNRISNVLPSTTLTSMLTAIESLMKTTIKEGRTGVIESVPEYALSTLSECLECVSMLRKAAMWDAHEEHLRAFNQWKEQTKEHD